MTNFQGIISSAIDDKRPCVFISPHLDDAVFSAGGLILELAEKTDVSIVTLFTKPESSTNTLSAKKFLKISGYPKSQEKLFAERKEEDTRACKIVGVKCIHLGFTDAMWRKKDKVGMIGKLFGNIFPEINHLYPFYRLNVISGKPAKGDLATITQIKNNIASLVKEIGEAVVFCPLGVGNHVDHIITRDICAEIFPRAIFWTDFPYNLNSKSDSNFISKMSLFPCIWNKNLDKKKKLILEYKTQIKSVAPLLNDERTGVLEEIFYIADKVKL